MFALKKTEKYMGRELGEKFNKLNFSMMFLLRKNDAASQ